MSRRRDGGERESPTCSTSTRPLPDLSVFAVSVRLCRWQGWDTHATMGCGELPGLPWVDQSSIWSTPARNDGNGRFYPLESRARDPYLTSSFFVVPGHSHWLQDCNTYAIARRREPSDLPWDDQSSNGSTPARDDGGERFHLPEPCVSDTYLTPSCLLCLGAPADNRNAIRM